MKRYASLLIFTSVILGHTALAKDTYWPREIKTKQGIITLYQLSPESLKGNNLYGRAAVSVKQKKESEPVFGAFWFNAHMLTDRDERMVTLESIKIENLKFPEGVTPSKAAEYKDILEQEIPKLSLEFPLDELLATIEEAGSGKSENEGLNTSAPEIIIKNVPAVLITIDGEPRIEDIEGSSMQQVFNTPYFIVYDPKLREFWLYGDGMWFVTVDATNGKWKYEPTPPPMIQGLIQETEEEKETRQGVPVIPEIIVRTSPAELIVTDGEPSFTPIEKTSLLYVKNTQSDVFLDIHTQSYYILISGRWYYSSALTGPWNFIDTDRLPEDFARIPEGGEKDNVLASVAGTDAADEAVLDATIPQTATVRRSEASVEVSYDGNPDFISIPGTRVAYAENSPNTVLLINNRYYACENAVWFESERPMGPWAVCVRIPDEVQNIPPSSPVNYVKYVYIYDYTPELVYVGYTPGYTGCYIQGRTVVYGTGFRYHSWYGRHYYPRPMTYGYQMHYDPYNGWCIGFSSPLWRPYSWFTYSYAHPVYHYHSYGGYWGPPAYYPHYYHDYHHYYGPNPIPYSAHNTVQDNRSTRNIYYNHRSGVESSRRSEMTSSSTRPSVKSSRTSSDSRSTGVNTQTSTRPSTSTRPATTRPTTQPSTTQPSTRPSTSTRPTSTSTGSATTKPATRTSSRNNVYTDRDGNVYRRTDQEWQKRENNTWKPATQATPATRPVTTTPTTTQPATPTTTRQTSTSTVRPELDRQSYSRERGVQRTTNAQATRPATTSRSSSTAKPQEKEKSGTSGRRQ